MYIPDWHMLRKLKDYDNKLNIRWHTQKQRWAITREVVEASTLSIKEQILFLVQNPNKTYRPLDERVVLQLKKGDTHTRTPERVVEEMIDKAKQKTIAENKDRKNEFEALAKDIVPFGGYDDPNVGTRNIPKEDIESADEFAEKREIEAYHQDQEALAV